MTTILSVTYENTHYGEYEQYETTFEELIDSFNGTLNEKIVGNVLQVTGEAILENGYATTIVLVKNWGAE